MQDVKLTDREKQILLLAKDGLSSKEIANLIRISKTTVDEHFKNIRKKLKVTSRLAAVMVAIESGFI